MTDPERRLAAALQSVDAGHAAGRDRLLAALAAEPVPTPRRRFVMLRRSWPAVAALAACLVAGFFVLRPPGALAATAAAIREAGSFKARMSTIDFPAGVDAEGKDCGTYFWSPDGMRCEEPMGGPTPQITIELVGKPGLQIRPQNITWMRLDPEKRANPFFGMIAGLADARGRGAIPLGRRKIEDVTCIGYELPLKRLLDPWEDVDGAMHVWFDPATKRPVRLVITGAGAPPGKALRMDRFEWGLPTTGWFDTTPPAGFTEFKSNRLTDEQMAGLIVVGLRLYAEKTGHYPKVRRIYGDQMGDELAKLLGRPNRDGGYSIPTDRPFDPINPRELFGAATLGFSCINGLQRDNDDCAYNGRRVGPSDAAKVLVRWKQDDGTYRVIFGDLRTEVLTAEQLKAVER